MADIETAVPACIAFFERSGLSFQDMIECDAFLESHFPGITKKLVTQQGYCSYTVRLGNDRIIQFRTDNYQLDLSIIEHAQKVFGPLVPTTEYLGKVSSLNVYVMVKIAGISLKEFRAEETSFPEAHNYRRRMCEDFAVLMARGWHLYDETPFPKGVVGSSLEARLKMLGTRLPGRFRAIAKHLLSQLPLIESLPWTITHGDLVASNIMLDPNSGHISGLVDWAEAEILPFGTCFYGLEELLGQMASGRFSYCPDAALLRKVFWETLLETLPDMRHHLTAVGLARDLGILLWHGIAFDDGRIDRVVQEGRDDEEISYLDAFLDISTQQGDWAFYDNARVFI